MIAHDVPGAARGAEGDTDRDQTLRRGSRVALRRPEARDGAAFLAAVARSGALHESWVHPPADAAAYATYLERAADERCCCALVVERQGGALVGVINASEIVRGCFQSAYLGYYAFSGYEGRGLFGEGLSLFCDHAFTTLRLHRLEANIQPDNLRSLRLVERLGFRREGYSPRYIQIAGRWRDHERWALLAESWWARRHGAAGEPPPLGSVRHLHGRR